nr:MAG: replication associated protein [Cressdnaviricota sp.]
MLRAGQTTKYITWTLNNHTEEERIHIAGSECTYVTYGFETAPTTGTPHLQGYAESDKPRSTTWWKNQLGQRISDIQKRLGTQEQAIKYCQKGEQSKDEWNEWKEKGGGWLGPNWGLNANFVEHGEKAKIGKKGQRNDLPIIRDIIMKDHGTMLNVIDACTGYQALRGGQIMLSYRPMKKRREKRYIHWYHGATGFGKTDLAYVEACEGTDDEPYWSNDSLKWFDGYCGQKRVIFDDYRPRMVTFEFMLRILDKYPVRVPFKGGYVEWEAEEIWITSCKSPEELYTWEGNLREDIGQLLRRIDHTRIYSAPGVYVDFYNDQ